MGKRVLRVNELVRREISEILHTRYQEESVYITITEVSVTRDLRQARVYYSVLGDEVHAYKAGQFLTAVGTEIRMLVGKRIVLKFLPHFTFVYDESLIRGDKMNQLIDELGLSEESN